MEVDLLGLVETFKRLAKQVLGKHIVIRGSQRMKDHSFRNTED
jgi:hypothetical protein